MARKAKSPRRRAIEQFFVHWLAVPASLMIRALPLSAVRRMGLVFGWLVVHLTPRRRRMMRENIRRSLGQHLSDHEVARIISLSTINVAKTLLELAKLQWMSEEQLLATMSWEGFEHVDAALERGRGVLLITAHFGNWEYGGALSSVRGYPMNVIARDANDPLVRSLVNRGRESKGMRVFGRASARDLLRALKNNECLAILPDQHAADAAVRVTFMGRPADTATGPAMFALRTGATILPCFTYREPGDHIHLVVQPRLEFTESGDRDGDVIAITQMINDVISEAIRDRPEQWLWLHDRWKAERDADADTS